MPELTPYTVARHRAAVDAARVALMTALRALDLAEAKLAKVEAPPPPPKFPTRQRASKGVTKKARKKATRQKGAR